MKNQKNLLIIIGIAVVAIAFFVIWGAQQPAENNNSADVIYFYGQGCPHCAKVSDFLDQNKIAEKVSFAKKEVWFNKSNSDQMMAKAQECGIKSEDLGVPFLWARGQCLVGDADIIDFFKKEAGL